MRRVLPTLLLCLFLSPVLHAKVIVKTDFSPEAPWVGQQLVIKIDVLSETGWSKISRLGEIEVPGAFVKIIDRQGIRLNDTIDGQSVTGQRYELFVYPQRQGEIVIPAIPVEVSIQTWGAEASTTQENTEVPSIRFNARLPDNVELNEGLVSTTNLTARQSWQTASSSDNYHVGDALKRTIVLEAENVPGMAFTPVTFSVTDSIKLYPAEAEIDDQVNRGTLTVKITDQATYVLQKTGKVEIPAITISWWNIREEKLQSITLEGKKFDVQKAVEYSNSTGTSQLSSGQLSSGRFCTIDIIKLIVILSAVSVVFIRLFPVFYRKLVQWKKQQQASEPAHFKRLIKTVKGNNAPQVFAALMRWLDKINPGSQPALLDDFVRRYGDEKLQRHIKALLINLKNSNKPFDAAALTSSLTKARQRWLDLQAKADFERRALPELN